MDISAHACNFANILYTLLKQPLREDGQVIHPVLPTVSAFGFVVFVRILLLIQILTINHIILIQEIFFTTSYPIELWSIGKLLLQERFSLLEFLHFRQIDAPHHAIITDEMIQCAFDSLRAHQYEPDAEYDDIIVCYPPVATRVDAINRDQAAWNDFINVRNAYEGNLNGAQKRAYRNATNNLKWSKLWLLKNEYRNMGLTGGYYEDLFLPFDCTDEELMEYNYYEKVILTGNHRY